MLVDNAENVIIALLEGKVFNIDTNIEKLSKSSNYADSGEYYKELDKTIELILVYCNYLVVYSAVVTKETQLDILFSKKTEYSEWIKANLPLF